jgi:putative intracellular protease/amidase
MTSITEKRAARMAIAHLSVPERTKHHIRNLNFRHPGRHKEVRASWARANRAKLNTQSVARYALQKETGSTYYQRNKERLKEARRERYAAAKAVAAVAAAAAAAVAAHEANEANA